MSSRKPVLCLVIVVALSLVALIGQVGIIVLAIYRVEPPSALVTTVGVSLGSLGSFLVSIPRSPSSSRSASHFPPSH